MKTVLLYLSIIVLSITACIGVIDIYMAFYPFTDGINKSLITRAWYTKFWPPVNSFGYRDIEPPHSPDADKQNIFVIGASFVAGLGIEQVKDRFVNLIRQSLGKKYNVVMLADQGWYTTEEYHALEHFPYKPDVIVLSYSVNDIEGAAHRVTHSSFRQLPNPGSLWMRSYALNFVYWRIYALTNFQGYLPYLNSLYANPAIWQEHTNELSKFITYSEMSHARLIVVLFPNLKNPAASQGAIEKAQSFFEAHHVETINLIPYLKNIHEPIIVNNLDAHPNIALHRYLSELLLTRLKGEPHYRIAPAMP